MGEHLAKKRDSSVSKKTPKPLAPWLHGSFPIQKWWIHADLRLVLAWIPMAPWLHFSVRLHGGIRGFTWLFWLTTKQPPNTTHQNVL